MDGERLVHVVHGDVVPQLPQEVVRPGQRPADLERVAKIKVSFGFLSSRQ